MTIQPEFWPFVSFNTALATTPSPRMTRIMVPMSSARKRDITLVWVESFGLELIKVTCALSTQNALLFLRMESLSLTVAFACALLFLIRQAKRGNALAVP